MRTLFRVRHGVLAVLCLMYFIAYVDRVNISVAGPTMRKELGLTRPSSGSSSPRSRIRTPPCRSSAAGSPDRFGPRLVLAAAEPAVGGGDHPDRPVVERRLARLRSACSSASAKAARFQRRRARSPSGCRSRERGFAQGITHSFVAARRRGHAADRPRDRGAIRLARVVHRARVRQPRCGRRLWLASFRDTPDEHPWVSRAEHDG